MIEQNKNGKKKYMTKTLKILKQGRTVWSSTSTIRYPLLSKWAWQTFFLDQSIGIDESNTFHLKWFI